MMKNKKSKSFIKRLGAIGVVLAMLFSMFIIGTGCTHWETDYEWGEDSFYFSVTANKEYARIDDEIEITATFKNLSGRNLLVSVSGFHGRPTQLSDIFRIGNAFTPTITFPRTLRIPKDSVITKTINYCIGFFIDIYYEIHAINYVFGCVIFYMGRTNERYWIGFEEKPNTVFLQKLVTLNIVSEDTTYE